MICSEKLNVYRVIICASVHAPVYAWVPACAGAPADVLVSLSVLPLLLPSYVYICTFTANIRVTILSLVCVSVTIRPISQA